MPDENGIITEISPQLLAMSEQEQLKKKKDHASRASNCFVCGSDNPIGLGVVFSLKKEICVANFTPQKEHGGYDNLTHGGILFSLLDDVMANWVWLQGEKCFTARADIRYRSQLPIGTAVRLEGRCLKRKGRLAQMAGKIIRVTDEFVVATATGSFMTETS